MAKSTAKPSLLDQAKDIPGVYLNWLDKLPGERRKEVTDLLQAKRRGEIKASFDALAKLLNSNGIEVNRGQVADACRRLLAD